ncbi:MAG: hypothetical protein FWF98_01205 [Dehalococcoidia bacterium]|nr:hypothetical protein [Dehalococcoidia bacterium]
MNVKAIIIVAGFVLFIAAPMLYLAFGRYMYSCSQPDPPLPEITFGEFPFHIEYEIHGERVVVEDSVICEFDGVATSWGGQGKYLKWKSYLSSDKTAPFGAALKVDGENQVYFSLGSPEYYMGAIERNEPNFYVFKVIAQGNNSGRKVIETDELYSIYGIKVMSYVFSSPIENIFK